MQSIFGVAQAVVVIVLALVTYVVLKILTDLLLKALALDENIYLKLVGLFLGVVRWIGILSFVFLLVGQTDLGMDIHEGSQWGPHLAPIAPTLIEFITGVVPQGGIVV